MNQVKIKKSIVIAVFIIGGIIGLIASVGVYYGLALTSGEKFCVVCHEMDPMVIAYSNDVHSGKGKSGVKAQCVDCHLPHDGNVINYIYAKARNGVVEGYIHFFKDPENIDWHKNREKKEHFVFDNGCLHCHENLVDNKLTSPQARKMHAHYQSLLNTDKQIGCASCHAEVGHSGLNNMLNYWKPEYKIYEKKAAAKKEEIKKAYFKDDYVAPKGKAEEKPTETKTDKNATK